MTSSRWGEGWGRGQIKNGQNSDGSGWLQGGRGGEGNLQKLDVQSYN